MSFSEVSFSKRAKAGVVVLGIASTAMAMNITELSAHCYSYKSQSSQSCKPVNVLHYKSNHNTDGTPGTIVNTVEEALQDCTRIAKEEGATHIKLSCQGYFKKAKYCAGAYKLTRGGARVKIPSLPPSCSRGGQSASRSTAKRTGRTSQTPKMGRN